jgi:hypothetical protein
MLDECAASRAGWLIDNVVPLTWLTGAAAVLLEGVSIDPASSASVSASAEACRELGRGDVLRAPVSATFRSVVIGQPDRVAG